MAIFTIADLHLSFGANKPMDIFGENWENHTEKIKEDWVKKVHEEDIVLLLGDFSWAMNLEDTYQDFKYLNELPGKKILLKGNHDYWWSTVKKMKEYLIKNKFQNIDFLYNNSFYYENYIICGTRGWNVNDVAENQKMLKRENLRLELSIQDAINKYGTDKKIIIAMHYPPITKQQHNSEFLQTMQKYPIERCFYGHLHGNSHNDAINKRIKNIDFQLVSCDYTDFKLVKII